MSIRRTAAAIAVSVLTFGGVVTGTTAPAHADTGWSIQDTGWSVADTGWSIRDTGWSVRDTGWS